MPLRASRKGAQESGAASCPGFPYGLDSLHAHKLIAPALVRPCPPALLLDRLGPSGLLRPLTNMYTRARELSFGQSRRTFRLFAVEILGRRTSCRAPGFRGRSRAIEGYGVFESTEGRFE